MVAACAVAHRRRLLIGCAIALVAWSLWRYVPSKPVALIGLGSRRSWCACFRPACKPDPAAPQTVIYGALCTTLMLLTGVSGPLFDSFFLGGRLDRREIVATKSVCQLFGHAMKLAYFTALVDHAAGIDPIVAALAVAASLIGTTLARPVLETLTDSQYRGWATRIITAIACYYLATAAISSRSRWCEASHAEHRAIDLRSGRMGRQGAAQPCRGDDHLAHLLPAAHVWEDAVDRGLVVRKNSADGAIVEVTARGRISFLPRASHHCPAACRAADFEASAANRH